MGTLVEIGQLLASSVGRAPWGWALLATVMLGLIKVWPVLALQAQMAKEKLRTEKRDDLHSCKEELRKMSERMDAVEERAHMLDIRLNGALMAYKILDADLQITHPFSPALAQARAALTVAFEISPTPPDMQNLLHEADAIQ